MTLWKEHGKIKERRFEGGGEGMKPNLIQQQTLQWKMNQTLLQSIHILQLSSIELTDYINEVVKENPLIEEVNYDYDIQQYRKSHSEDVSIDINRKEETMYDKLKIQLSGVKVPKELKPVVEYGIDSLNDDGYLDIDLETWAEDCRTTVPMAERPFPISSRWNRRELAPAI